MVFTQGEQDVINRAVNHARTIKKAFARKYTDASKYLPESNPVSVFMAGSPGAGKTEVSKRLLAQLGGEGKNILRIDPDELRGEFEEYDGSNSYLFQQPVSILVDRIHDLVLKQGQAFLLDGTLSSLPVARRNIQRSISRERYVQILYIYQNPLQAWRFVQARELLEGRNIRANSFIEQYFAAREVVNTLKDEYGKQICVDLLVKNIDGSDHSYRAGVDRIDTHIPERYSRSDIENMLL